MGIFAGLSVGAASLAREAADSDRRWDQFGYDYLAGSFLVVGAILRAAIPAPDVWGPKRIAQQDESTPDARVAKLRYATEVFQGASKSQSVFASPLGVVTSTVTSAVGGTVKAVKWKGQTPGLTAGMFLVNPALSGLAIWTAPREAIASWSEYRQTACPSEAADSADMTTEVDFLVSPAGASLIVTF